MSNQPLKELISGDGYNRILQLFDDVAELKAREFGVYPNPSVRAYHNALQTINDVTLTKVILNSERWDTGEMHDTVVNNTRLIAPVDGVYAMNANCIIEGDANGLRTMYFTLNNIVSFASVTYSGFATDHHMSLDGQYKLAEGDYIEWQIYQNSGSNLLLASIYATSPEFTMTLIGQ